MYALRSDTRAYMCQSVFRRHCYEVCVFQVHSCGSSFEDGVQEIFSHTRPQLPEPRSPLPTGMLLLTRSNNDLPPKFRYVSRTPVNILQAILNSVFYFEHDSTYNR